MKKILFLLFVLMPMMANAQNDRITEVLGVRFGTTYNEVKSALESKYGKEARLVGDDILLFFDLTYEGIEFSPVFFVFVNNKLNMVKMSILCTSKEEAEEERDNLARIMGAKYQLVKDRDEDGDCYKGATSPLNEDLYGFVIDIQEQTIAMKEELPYVANLVFGPYGYGEDF